MRDTKIKIIRTSTVALSLNVLLKGQLKNLNQFYHVKAISGYDTHLEEVITRENVEIIPLKMERRISIFNDIISLIKMYKILKEEKPDIVHSITPKAGLITMIAGKLAGVPIRMHTFTGLIFPYTNGVMQKVLIFMDRILCYCATHVYPEGNGVKKDLLKYKITNKPLNVLANGNINGVDINYFKPNTESSETIRKIKNEYNINEDNFVFCFVGRIVLEKGIQELFSAFKKLYKENENIRLLLIGSFDDSENVNKKLQKVINNHPGFISVGWQNNVKSFLSICHCFVHPSYREGFPNVVLQASAMEVPCIVTNISGSNEIIQDHENGLIVEKKDSIGLFNAMKELLEDADLRKSIGKSARKTVVDNFKQSIVWEALKDEYKKNIEDLKKKKIIRITTVPLSLDKLLEGQLKHMSNFYNIIAISSDDNGHLRNIAHREGVKYHAVELTRKITLIKDLYALIKLVYFFRKFKPDIVHTHTPKAGTVGMWAAKIAGAPIRLHTVAGMPMMEAKGLKKIILIVVEKLTYASANYILPNSYGLKKYIINNNLTNEKKLKVIGNGSSNGINLEYFKPDLYSKKFLKALKNKLDISDDDFVYVFVGRLVGDKGINELVTAFKNLNQPNTKLLLVGNLEVELDPLLPESIQEIDNNTNIITTGWQKDVRKYLAISSALAFPSYREGLPNVVLQAGAMGLPAIVTDINGCNEIITDGLNGLIIPVKDKKALKNAMDQFYSNKDLYNTLKENARTAIVDKYEQKQYWEFLRNFYDEVLINQFKN